MFAKIHPFLSSLKLNILYILNAVKSCFLWLNLSNFNHHRSPFLTNKIQNETEADRHETKVHQHLITA